jgi:hypothetical protein
MTHSERAQLEVSEAVPAATTIVVPHPIRAARRTVPTDKEDRSIVTVLGQYKADRDIPLLEWLATVLPPQARLQIVGRGWPTVNGWQVDARFIPEEEFDATIQQSSVVLIPYRRFYQSGVAIRALEQDVPVVGPRASVLSEIFGAESSLLAGPDGRPGSLRLATL